MAALGAVPVFAAAATADFQSWGCGFELENGVPAEGYLIREKDFGFLPRIVSVLQSTSLVQLGSRDGLRKAFEGAAYRLTPEKSVRFPHFQSDDGQKILAYSQGEIEEPAALTRLIDAWKILSYSWQDRDSEVPMSGLLTIGNDLNALEDWLSRDVHTGSVEFLNSAKLDLRANRVKSREIKAIRQSFTGVIMKDEDGTRWTMLFQHKARNNWYRDFAFQARLSPASTAQHLRIDQIKPPTADDEARFFLQAGEALQTHIPEFEMRLQGVGGESFSATVTVYDSVAAKMQIKHGWDARTFERQLSAMELVDVQNVNRSRVQIRLKMPGDPMGIKYHLIAKPQDGQMGKLKLITMFRTYDP